MVVWCADLRRGHGRTLESIAGLGPEQLAQVPPGLANSIATLVVHVAAVELRMAHRMAGSDRNREVPFGPRTATVRFALSLLPAHQAQHDGQMQMIRPLL